MNRASAPSLGYSLRAAALALTALAALPLASCGGDGSAPAADPVSAAPAPRITDVFDARPDGTVAQPAAGLVWARDPSPRALAWRDARNYCANLALGGRDDWRMPTTAELRGLYDALAPFGRQWDRRAAPFEWRDGTAFWTSSRHKSYTSIAETVSFETDLVYAAPKTFELFVRPVRASSAPEPAQQ